MPQIPLYKQNVAPTSQGTGAQLSVEAAVAPWREATKLGLTIAGEMKDYQKRKSELKEKADIADYETRKRNLQTSLIEAKNDAMMNKKISYLDIYDKVYQPMLNKFNEDTQRRGYSKTSLRNIGEQWGVDRAMIEQKEVSEREQLELSDYVERIDQQAQGLIASNDPKDIAKGKAMYDDLSSIVGEARSINMKSIAELNKIRVDISEFNRQYNETGDHKKYIEQLESVNTDALLGNHAKTIELERNAKINNITGQVVKKMTKSSDFVFDKIVTDDLEGADLAGLYNDNPLMGEALDKSLNIQLQEAAKAGDKDAVKAIEIMDKMVAGTESWSGAVRKIGDLNSSSGVLALYICNSYAKDIVMSQDNMSAYEYLFRMNDRPISVDDNTKDYIHTLSYYMKRKSENHESFLKEKLSAFKGWQKNPDGKTYEEFRVEQFGEDAKADVQKLTAPQINKSVEVKRKTADGRNAIFNAETKEFIRYE